MKATILSSLCSFALGVGIGSYLIPPYAGMNRNKLVNVNFCFLLKNPDLIGSRRFITRANIMPLVPHAPVLESDVQAWEQVLRSNSIIKGSMLLN